MARCARRLPQGGIHPSLEVLPTILGDLYLSSRQLAGRLEKSMKENDQAPRSLIQDPVVLRAHMAAQLPQLTLDLGAEREWQVRRRVGEEIETTDLIQQGRAPLGMELHDEIEDRLTAVCSTVVDSLEIAQAAATDAGAAVDASRRATDSISAASTRGTWWT